MPKMVPEGKRISRPPIKPYRNPTDIYISKKTKLRALLETVKKLLLIDRKRSVTLHGLGARTTNAIYLALRLESALAELHPVLTVKTSVTQLIDDILPDDEDEDITAVSRTVPAVHILLALKDQSIFSLEATEPDVTN